MRSLLFSACVVLAVLGCGGDMDENMPCSFCGDGYGYVSSSSGNSSSSDVLMESSSSGEESSGSSSSESSGSHIKCGGDDYDPSTQFCFFKDNKIYDKCGDREHFPDASAVCSNGNLVFNYGSLYYEGQTYKTIKIGEQTWMAENLNYDVTNSKCNEGRPDITLTPSEILVNCGTYGRLYDWATAMAFDVSCNNTSCSDQIQSKHRGICPIGWHIPNEAEWNTLITTIGGSLTAGTILKTISGWEFGGNGTDNYGFSALPGGYGVWDDLGKCGFWRSTLSNSGATGVLYMFYDGENAPFSNQDSKYNGISVRCLKD